MFHIGVGKHCAHKVGKRVVGKCCVLTCHSHFVSVGVAEVHTLYLGVGILLVGVFDSGVMVGDAKLLEVFAADSVKNLKHIVDNAALSLDVGVAGVANLRNKVKNLRSFGFGLLMCCKNVKMVTMVLLAIHIYNSAKKLEKT